MTDYKRRLERLEPKPQHDEQMDAISRRIILERFQWRVWLLDKGPPALGEKEKLDFAAPYCNGFDSVPGWIVETETQLELQREGSANAELRQPA